MISAITISGEATYPKERTCIDELRKQVLFFGDNGSGKTTISRIVAKPDAHPGCSVSAPSGTLFQVYNSDFVDVAYRESAYPGVFTLGEKEREIEDRIEELQGKRTELVLAKILGKSGGGRWSSEVCEKGDRGIPGLRSA